MERRVYRYCTTSNLIWAKLHTKKNSYEFAIVALHIFIENPVSLISYFFINRSKFSYIQLNHVNINWFSYSQFDTKHKNNYKISSVGKKNIEQRIECDNCIRFRCSIGGFFLKYELIKCGAPFIRTFKPMPHSK